MQTTLRFARAFGVVIGVCGLAVAVSGQQPGKAPAASVAAPIYKVDPFWPKMPLRNKWLLQGIPTMVTDSKDHIWVLSRPRDIRPDENMTFSHDAQQKYIFIADGTNHKVWVHDRKSGAMAGSIGSLGRYPGQFFWIDAIAMDSKGNLYTGEVWTGKRVQKFNLMNGDGVTRFHPHE